MITEALFCLALTVYHEARSQPLIEQVAVAQVVLNRVSSPNFPNTVCAVVKENRYPNQLHKCQFSFMCDADYVKPYWANTQKKVAQVGRHIFYQ